MPVIPHTSKRIRPAAPSMIEIPIAGISDFKQMNKEENIPVPLVYPNCIYRRNRRTIKMYISHANTYGTR